MSALIKLAASLIWLLILPVLAGLGPLTALQKKREVPFPESLAAALVFGELISFGLYELVGIPVLLITDGLGFMALTVGHALLLTAAAVYGAVTALGAYRARKAAAPAAKPAARPGYRIRKENILCVIGTVLALGVLGYQLYMASTHFFYDGDDAYYVATSVISYETGTFYRYLPYTGGSTELDVRHALALLPIWFASVAKLSATHPSIVIRTVAPFVLLPLADAAMLLVGSEILGKDRRRLPGFMLVIQSLQLFGNVSIYTPENFLILRTGQGKSLLVNFLFPLLFLSFLWIYREVAWPETHKESEAGATPGLILLAAVGWCAGLMSAMGPALILGSTVLFAAVMALQLKRPALLKKAALAMLPAFAYLLLFAVLVLTRGL